MGFDTWKIHVFNFSKIKISSVLSRATKKLTDGPQVARSPASMFHTPDLYDDEYT